MEQMPTGDFGANALYFGIGILSYNLFIAQKYFTMPVEWAGKTIKSIRINAPAIKMSMTFFQLDEWGFIQRGRIRHRILQRRSGLACG